MARLQSAGTLDLLCRILNYLHILHWLMIFEAVSKFNASSKRRTHLLSSNLLLEAIVRVAFIDNEHSSISHLASVDAK